MKTNFRYQENGKWVCASAEQEALFNAAEELRDVALNLLGTIELFINEDDLGSWFQDEKTKAVEVLKKAETQHIVSA